MSPFCYRKGESVGISTMQEIRAFLCLHHIYRKLEPVTGSETLPSSPPQRKLGQDLSPFSTGSEILPSSPPHRKLGPVSILHRKFSLVTGY